MKILRVLILALFMLGIAVCDSSPTYAAVPHLINYQGRLTDKAGNPLNGSYVLTFRIYDAGNAGNLLWQGTYSNVSITKGIFGVLLGDVSDSGYNFEALAFDKPYWLEVKVGDDVMSPRQRIASSAYAISAANGTPRGGIIMWSGNISDIPVGWALCDGANGTPDLRDRFIVGAGKAYSVAVTGGEAMHTLTIAEIPAHSHTYTKGVFENESDGLSRALKGYQTDNTSSVGGGQPHENRPPYYALAYIMKL